MPGRILITGALFFLLTLIAGIAMAQVYEVEAAAEYVMGDNDTKLEAKKIALEQAKRNAVEEIGAYLATETVVKNRLLAKDEVRIYTSAIVKTTILSETLVLIEKNPVLKIRISAKVDIGVLDQKIKEIQGDKKRREEIYELQKENARLLAELESLSAKIKSSQTADHKTLVQKREVVFSNLEKNQKSMTIAFEKGTFANLALKSRDELTEMKRNIDETFQLIVRNTEYSLTGTKIRYKGKCADLTVDIDYKIEKVNEILGKMETFFESPRVNYPPKGSGLKMETICLNMYGFKGNHSSVLSEYYWEKRIRIYAIANKWKSFVDVNGYGDCAHSWGTVVSNKTDIHIRNIPVNELKNINKIDLKIVIEKGDPSENRRMRWDVAFPGEGCN